MEVKLTRDGDALICLIYKEYCQRRKVGKTIEESAYMGDDTDIHDKIAPKWPLDDITHLCWYLNGKNLLDVSPGDNKANFVSLSDEGIRYMENRFPTGFEGILKALSALSQVVAPWI